MPRFSNTHLAMIALILDEEQQQRRKKRRWVHEAWKMREDEGEYAMLYPHLIQDQKKFFEYFRMSENCFNILLSKLEIHLKKQDTHWRKAITPKERLSVCLRFLATGDSLKTISFSYRLGHSTVQNIVNSTCKVITECLMSEMFPKPTNDMWKAIAQEFNMLWNFPNCIGAIDGKHVTIQAPNNSGSLYFNYKKTYSIVLLALVDTKYNFIAVNVGEYGKNSDGGILANSTLRTSLEQNALCVPNSTALPGTVTDVPYVIVADEAFPLKTYMMRPYPGQDLDESRRIFNSRLSRARRVVENAFGILSQKFRIYNRRLQANPENVDYIVLATCILHNFIKKYDMPIYGYNCLDESLQVNINIFENLPRRGGNTTKDAFQVREIFKDYFNSETGSMFGRM